MWWIELTFLGHQPQFYEQPLFWCCSVDNGYNLNNKNFNDALCREDQKHLLRAVQTDIDFIMIIESNICVKTHFFNEMHFDPLNTSDYCANVYRVDCLGYTDYNQHGWSLRLSKLQRLEVIFHWYEMHCKSSNT